MFNKEYFSEILTKIYKTYSNQREFAQATGVNRGYLSQYMNKKLDNPPSPKKLKGIAQASNGITNYEELMNICGYLVSNITNTLSDAYVFAQIPLFNNLEELLTYDNNIENAPHYFYTRIYIKEDSKDFFAFTALDNSMSPLLDTGDIAIVHKQNTYENGQTHLFLLDNNIYIRKIIDLNDKIELHSTNPYCPIIKLTKEDMEKRKFEIIGKVTKSENRSAYQ